MALTNYTELQATIASYLVSSTLTAQIVDAIRLVESSLNYGGAGPAGQIIMALRVRQMEQRATANLTSGDDSIELPSDFLAAKTLKLDGYPPLQFMTKEQLDGWYADGGVSRPMAFCVAGNEYIVRPVPDSNYSVENLYYKQIPALASNATNWLLTASPQTYLYGALAEMRRFARNPTLQNVDYAALFAANVDALRLQNVDAMTAGVPTMRPMTVV